MRDRCCHPCGHISALIITLQVNCLIVNWILPITLALSSQLSASQGEFSLYSFLPGSNDFVTTWTWAVGGRFFFIGIIRGTSLSSLHPLVELEFFCGVGVTVIGILIAMMDGTVASSVPWFCPRYGSVGQREEVVVCSMTVIPSPTRSGIDRSRLRCGRATGIIRENSTGRMKLRTRITPT